MGFIRLRQPPPLARQKKVEGHQYSTVSTGTSISRAAFTIKPTWSFGNRGAISKAAMQNTVRWEVQFAHLFRNLSISQILVEHPWVRQGAEVGACTKVDPVPRS